MSIFLYTEQQKELAGKDGEKEFNRVFGTESRVVVVFYRENWGQTQWTRIEETAIRNRAYEEGYDFVTFISLDPQVRVPKWLPRTRLWVGFDRGGVDGTASVIEARVQEAGGTPKKESVEDHAARINREIANNKAKVELLKSEKGVKAAENEIQSIFCELGKICDSIANPETHMTFERHQENRDLYIYNNKLTLAYNWDCRFSNTLDESELYINLWRGKVGFPDIIYIWEKPNRLKQLVFLFDIAYVNQYGWREVSGTNRFFSSAQLAEFSMKMFLDEIRDQQVQKQR
jgi:hypothetical protein